MFEFASKVSGRFRTAVVDAATGEIISRGRWQKNLILDSGLDLMATRTLAEMMNYCVAGTGTTPTRDVPDGDTFSQAGTTVTRQTGTDRDFIAGDVGKLLRFGSGQECRITAFVDVDNVTVTPSQTVAATTITLYRVAQTGLATEVKRSNTYPTYTWEDGIASQAVLINGVLWSAATTSDFTTGITTFRRSYDFSAESGGVNYTELALSYTGTAGNNVLNRIVLAGAVSLIAGQLLRAEVEITITQSDIAGATIETEIPGWPRPYNITTAAASGSAFTITVSEAHHYLAGGNIRLSGITRLKVAITAAASDPSTLTITAVGHGRSGGDTIIIEGVTPTAYNGRWTVAAAPDADTLEITSAADPGPGTVFGTVREQEPRGTVITVATSTSTAFTITAAGHGYTAGDLVVIKGVVPTGYNGVWRVASVSGDDFTVTTAANPGTGTFFGDTYAAAGNTWYDGSRTIASVTSTTIVITNATSLAAGLYGTATNNVRRRVVPLKMPAAPVGFTVTGNALAVMSNNATSVSAGTPQINIFDAWGSPGWTNSETLRALIPGTPTTFRPLGFPRAWFTSTGGNNKSAGACTGPTGTNDSGAAIIGTGSVVSSKALASRETYTAGTFYADVILPFVPGVANFTNIKIIGLGAGSSLAGDFDIQAYIEFEEPQRKDSTHTLNVTMRRTWSRDLSIVS